jgi:DNA-binding NarL/FixJ family response regulator
MKKGTLAAVVAFAGLVTMSVGASALDEDVGYKHPASVGSDVSPDQVQAAVKKLQGRIAVWADNERNVKHPGRIDGVYDEQTDRARISWQAWHNEICQTATARELAIYRFSCSGLTLKDLGFSDSEIRAVQQVFMTL